MRFFLQATQISGETLTITGTDAGHISRVLRMQAGEEITVCDMQKREYTCTLTSVLPDCVTARITASCPSDTEPPFHAVLYQALPKGDKMDAVVQKAVECGVSQIVPIETERCVVKLDAKGRAHKRERWQKIAESAAKQCGRGIIPTVSAPIPYAEALEELSADPDALRLFCYEGDGTEPLGKLLPDTVQSVRFLIGPEGGFSHDEVEKAKAAGAIPAGLGKRILRTETAASFVLSCLVLHWELS